MFTVLAGTQLCPCGYKIASQLSLIWEEVGPFKSPVSHCISAFLRCWFLSSEKKCPALFQKVPVPPSFFPSLVLQICFVWQNWQETEEINEKSQHGEGIWWRPSLEKVISRGSDAVSHSRKSSSVQRLLSHSVQPALALCKYNKVLSTQTHRLQWKTLSSPLLPPAPQPRPPPLSALSLSASLSLIQLLIWHWSKEINEVLQRKEGFIGRATVDRGSVMRIWWGGVFWLNTLVGHWA